MYNTSLAGGTWWEGDCFDIMPTLQSGSIGLIISDLPYNTTNCVWDHQFPLDQMWTQLKRLIRPGGAILLTGVQPFTSILVASQPKMFKHEWIWLKSRSGSPFTAKYRPMQKHESVLVFGRGKITYNPIMEVGEPYKRTLRVPPINNHKIGFVKDISLNNIGTRYPSTVQFFKQDWKRQDQVHPTQKPVSLFEYMIKTYSNEQDTVLDITAGAGSTALAAAKLNRRWVCIEKDTTYSQVAITRIQKYCDSSIY